ncbi:ribonuclease III [Pusillimonas sp. MFBS29]|uniref:ribonuclease III n=1 Tax=Pusillimonas sp. MFBS29 TaxID=2886690 RepID=UPI001D0FD9D1|nr:ribonuclease III [Pusillimonas sp. MFBS29]MCC2595159.1 ribonuclease III [Pusillimonas sp. MFBS29]
MSSLTTLQAALGHQFQDASLLELALTHRSHSAHHNERLEFLGDSVLNFVVASLLFARFPQIDEGDLSRLRANLVKQASLADIAGKLDLSQHLRLGEGELKSGGFRRPSILADALEALFGAAYLDGGFECAQKVIERQYTTILENVDEKTLGKDPKTLLQELLQARKLDLPVYAVVATHGAAHNQLFEVECRIQALDVKVSAGGASRRAAEQSAAELAIAAIKAIPQAKGQRKPRARKSTQLSLPVAVSQEKK